MGKAMEKWILNRKNYAKMDLEWQKQWKNGFGMGKPWKGTILF